MSVAKEVFEEVKKLSFEGLSNKEIAEETDIPFDEINRINSQKTFEKYEELFANREIKTEVISPGDKGFLKATLTKKEIIPISKVELGLMKAVKGLWIMIDILESKKAQLEYDIEQSEEYLKRIMKFVEEHAEK